MPRRSTPLYEFMSRTARPASTSAPAPRAGPAPEPAADHDSPLPSLAAGRIVRLPAGYLFLGLAGCLLLIIAAYTVGHSRGERAARERLDDGLLSASGLFAPSGRADDPLAAAGTAGGLVPPGLASPAGRATEPASSGAGGLGPIEKDPRTDEGLHYFVLATTKREGAIRLAEFCRLNGLAAYVIDGNNARFRRVIALPGLRSRSSPEVEALREQIRRIGQAWKARHPGESDLSDAYMIQ